MAIGRPCCSAKARASAADSTGPSLPATSGAPARTAVSRAVILLPSSRMASGAGADPGQPGVEDGLGEVGVLGQEAVAGVEGVGAGFGRDGEELGDVQVGVRGRVAVQAVGLVRGGDVQGVGVDVGVDGDGGQLRVVAGPGDADGDFTTVGDQDLAHQLLASSSVVACSVGGGGRCRLSAQRKRILPPIGTCAARSSWESTTTAITG